VKYVKNKKEEKILWVLDIHFADREDCVPKNTERHNYSWQDQTLMVVSVGVAGGVLRSPSTHQALRRLFLN